MDKTMENTWMGPNFIEMTKLEHLLSRYRLSRAEIIHWWDWERWV